MLNLCFLAAVKLAAPFTDGAVLQREMTVPVWGTADPGETVTVTFPLTDEVFLSWSEEAGDMVPMKGEWELLYGGNSSDPALQTITFRY